AVRAGDVEGDREAEPGAALVLIARVIEPEKRPEHVLAPAGRNAGAVVVDVDRQKTPIPDRLDGNPVRVALRIANEISKAALERIGPHGDQRLPRKRDFGIEPRALGVEAQILQK